MCVSDANDSEQLRVSNSHHLSASSKYTEVNSDRIRA